MSRLFCRVEGWHREIVDANDDGIKVQIHLARDPNVSSILLAGVIALDHERAPAGVTITENKCGISAATGCDLLEIGCATIWNAIMIDQAASAGTNWQFLGEWLRGHRNDAKAKRLELSVSRSLTQ